MHPHPALVALATLVPLTAATAQFQVSQVAPPNHARGASPAAPVTLRFAQPVDPTTATPATVRVAGRWSGPVPGVVSVAAADTEVTFAPLRPLFAGELATVFVTSRLLAANGTPLSGGFTASWWAAAAPSSGAYALDHVVDFRLPGEGLVRTYGFCAGDIDRDGAPDISATNEVAHDVRLLKNDGCGNFGPIAVSPLPAGSEPSPNEGADFNGDGWLDLAVANVVTNTVAVFRNDGAGNYLPPILVPIGGPPRGLVVLDFDGDGHVDIATTNHASVVLLRNHGNGTFVQPVFFDGGGVGERALAVADANGDGIADLFCSMTVSQTVTVLLGNGDGTFMLHDSEPVGGQPRQIGVGDLDGDGDVDCVVAEAGNSVAAVMFGDGAGGLGPPTGYPVGDNPLSVDLADLEGDGDLDIVVASFQAANATVLRNDGNGQFGDVTTLPTAIAGSCAVLVDYDRDGDTDILVVDELEDQAFVYRQVGPDPQGVQPPGCEGALRVDSFANRGGFGSAAPHPAPGGQLTFLSISGAPGAFVWLFAGAPLQFGIPSPFGFLNLDLSQPLELLVNGFGGDPLGILDLRGETLIPVLVPNGMPPGSTFTLQCLVSTPAGGIVSNPEQLVF